MPVWRCVDRELDVFDRVHVMGIVNVTPDSFSDGGIYLDPQAAVDRALQIVDEGADIVDIGGESTRPGAEPVAEDEEIARVLPVVEAVVKATGVAVSIDTMKASVAKAALDAGAVIVNDVSAMRADAAMAAVVKDHRAGVVLMHMLGDPRTMQDDPQYDDVSEDVRDALNEAALQAQSAGIERVHIALDPGIGFGKTREHNLELLSSLRSFAQDGYPLVVGTSRKSFIGATLGGLPVEERLEGTAATVAWAVSHGANVVRVHDVKQMKRVVEMTEAIQRA